jgi:PKHD-type hydroxylase
LLVTIADVLSPEQVTLCREALAAAAWVDGRRTAGHQSGRVKRNQQVNDADPATRELQAIVLRALERSAGFVSAALPLKVFPPMFNRYGDGEAFGTHFDNAVMQVPGTPHRLRSDLSATLFLCDPADYDGGELVVEDIYGAQLYDLDAAIRHVAAGLPEHPAVVQLTGVYHNLLRGWAET